MLRRSIVLAVLVSSGTALADDWSLHVLGSGEVGWTDNVFSAPTDPVPGAPEREADFYTQLTPGGLFSWEKPRMIQELTYELDANLYAEHSEARSLNHRLGWRSYWLTSPLTDLQLAATATKGSTSTFSTATTAATGELVILPSGQSEFLGLDAREGFNWQRSRELRLSQSSQVRAFHTEDQASDGSSTGVEAGVGLGADRSWRADALGFTVDGNLVRLSQRAAMMTATTHQVMSQATLSWRRDLSRYWSSAIDGGAAMIVPLDDTSATVIQPTVGAAVAYSPDWGTGGLQLRRSVAPNLYIAQNTITDSASLNAWLPLPWLSDDPLEPVLSVQTTLGAARTAILSTETGETVSRFVIGTVDAAIGWQFLPHQVLGLRYQFLIQDTADDTMIQVFGYTRHTVLLTFGGRWPSRVAAEIPDRDALRVDRSDTTPVGEEPAESPR